MSPLTEAYTVKIQLKNLYRIRQYNNGGIFGGIFGLLRILIFMF